MNIKLSDFKRYSQHKFYWAIHQNSSFETGSNSAPLQSIKFMNGTWVVDSLRLRVLPARVRISVQRGDTHGGHSSHKLLFKDRAIPGLLFFIYFCFSMQFAEIGIRTAAALPTAPQPLPRTQGLSLNRTTRSQRGLKTYFRKQTQNFLNKV